MVSHNQRLTAGVWFSDRISSCGLFHISYPRVPEPLRNELRTMYRELCRDDMPNVRKAAAVNIGKFIATIEQPHVKNDIMLMFKDLVKDGMVFSKRVFCGINILSLTNSICFLKVVCV